MFYKLNIILYIWYMSKLTQYYIYAFLNLVVIALSFQYMIEAVLNLEYFYTILWAIIFSNEINSTVEAQQNLLKYYPHFEEEWLGVI